MARAMACAEIGLGALVRAAARVLPLADPRATRLGFRGGGGG